MAAHNENTYFNQPATETIGLDDSLSADDRSEHTSLPSHSGFEEATPTARVQYVQRCLDQIRSHLRPEGNHDDEWVHMNKMPSEDLAYAVQTKKIARSATDPEIRRAQAIIEQAAKEGIEVHHESFHPHNDREVIVLEGQVPLDALGSALEKLGFASGSYDQDKGGLDYVYSILKNHEKKKLKDAKKQKFSVAPESEEAAYSLAFKASMNDIASAIGQRTKQTSKL